MARPDWDDYFLGIADAVAARGECRRSLVGAVLVHDRRITSTGYNGAPAGEPSCLDGICPRERMGAAPGSLYSKAPCIAIHAEDNAVRDALRRGLLVQGGTMYVTKEPCEVCAGLLSWHELRVVWRDRVRRTRGSMDHKPAESVVSGPPDD
jgi:dCMP deaminase